MQSIKATSLALAAFVTFAASPLLNAQLRSFTNDNGTVIQAELVSHKGDKVKLKRTDGKEFEVNPSIFSKEDEAYIKNWKSMTPAVTNYNFKIASTKKKVEGTSVDMGYKRVKNQLWSYVISVTNGSQDPVSRFTVKYRVFYSNAAEGAYSASSSDRAAAKMLEGSTNQDAELAYNRVLELTTTPVQIDMVNYDGVGDRYKDQLIGCIVRIVDKDDNVIFDWVSPEVGMKGKSWLNTNPNAREIKDHSIIR